MKMYRNDLDSYKAFNNAVDTTLEMRKETD